MSYKLWINKALEYIQEQTTLRPEIAVVLGSGLGDFANLLADPSTIPTSSLPSYPVSTVQGHAGKLVFGHLKANGVRSKPILVFQGRVHFYETNDVEKTLLPVHIASELGAQVLLVTNAAGGINRLFSAGDLMLIEDVISLSLQINTVHQPLQNAQKGRTPLDPDLSRLIQKTASDLGTPLRKGTYCWLTGPSYETPAEIEMLRRLGADAVGMSTVPEIIRAHSLGMKVAGISLVSNMAAGMTGEKLSHEEVNQTAQKVKKSFTELIQRVILSL